MAKRNTNGGGEDIDDTVQDHSFGEYKLVLRKVNTVQKVELVACLTTKQTD